MPEQDEPPVWTPEARWALAGLVALGLGLLAWSNIGKMPFAARPLDLEDGVVPLAPIDLNASGEDRLSAIPGVGPAVARRIVAHRQANGPFRSVDELRRVHGIGPAMLDRIRDFLAVGSDERPVVVRGARPEETGKGKPMPDEALCLNAASKEDLMRLPGIGPVLAARIMEARPFASVDGLRKVKGIGAKTMEKLRPHVRIGE
ncbi:MAG: helix-hairpin-helix domain-containing protein [Gemmataceae bacterium]|nr:helix-hairpin-helix domain-containing protein [Gemmataceae bacterium]